MLRNYLKVIIRNFITDRMYTFINVLGLVLGLASCLIIAQYVQFEMNFDTGVNDKDQIYYAYIRTTHDNGAEGEGECHPAIAPFLLQSFPEVESAGRLFRAGVEELLPILHRDDDTKFYSKVKDAYNSDPAVLTLFSIPMIQGDGKNALKEPYTVVMTKALADKFFPGENAMDKTVSLPSPQGSIRFRITGICENPSPNSSFQFEALVSMAGAQFDGFWEWGAFQTFIKLKKGTDVAQFEKRINESMAMRFKETHEKYGFNQSVRLLAMKDFHFFQLLNNNAKTPVRFSGDKKLIKFIIIIGALILAASWANYISLTTARAIRRAKEVGLRKINGANRSSLVGQFLIEFFSLNLISMLMAITVAQILFPVFAMAIGSQAHWTFWNEPSFWLSALLFLFVSTLSAGIYPAFFMSRYQPSTVLKGNFNTSAKGSALRRALVFGQFTFAVCLLVSIYVIERQLNYLQNKDLGMSPDQVIALQDFELGLAYPAIPLQQMKAALANVPGVINVSGSQYYPGDQTGRDQYFYKKSDHTKGLGIRINQVSSGFFETMKIDLLYGRDFNEDPKADTNKIVINEKAAHELGFANAEEAIGEWLVYNKEERYEFQVIGVIKDYSESSKIVNGNDLFFHAMVPGAAHGLSVFLVKLSGDDIPNTLAQIENTWNKLFPNAAFDYFFLDDHFDNFYRDERQFAGVFRFFSIIGVVITCMGLFGLSAYNTGSRSKEIGIRKTVGASARSIMWLFSKEYFRMACFSSLIGIPCGIWLLNNWLKNYPNRINIEADLIIVPFIVTLLIAMLTVGYQTFSSARANPVASLRRE